MTKFYEIMSRIILFLIVLISLFSLYLVKCPIKVLQIDHFIVDKTDVCVGELMSLRIIGEKFHATPVSVTVDFTTNGTGVVAMSYTSNNPKGPLDKGRPFIVPPMARGRYQVRWTGIYPFPFKSEVKRSEWITVR